MFNLIVSADDEAWDGKPYTYPLNRCVRDYTDDGIKDEFGELSKSNIDEIKNFPCVFAYETSCNKDPKFGLLKKIKKRQQEVKIEYEIIDVDNFMTSANLKEWSFDLDIGKWELNRTHWAIKDVDLIEELSSKDIELPDLTQKDIKTVDITTHMFDVALSFPGEVRDYVVEIADSLTKEIGAHKCFYDNNYKAQLAQPSLDTLLQSIYKSRAKLVVVFLCEKYQEKEWCGLEFRAIREIIMSKKNKKIMFVKMDDGEVEGVFKTDGYIDGRTHSPKEIAKFIQERVNLL